MNDIIEAVNRAADEAVAKIAAATDSAELEAVRIAYLGRNGLFPELSKKMGSVPPRRTAGDRKRFQYRTQQDPGCAQ